MKFWPMVLYPDIFNYLMFFPSELGSKVNKGCNVDMWSLHQKVSGLVFVNPDIPALKYGQVMEDNAVNGFFDFMKKKHKNFPLHECGLYLNQGAPYIGGSPDHIVTCSCCNQLVWRLNVHIQVYYTQCLVQMAVTNMEHSYFMVWTPRGFVIDHIEFDNDKWYLLKLDLVKYYQNYYLKTIFSE